MVVGKKSNKRNRFSLQYAVGLEIHASSVFYRANVPLSLNSLQVLIGENPSAPTGVVSEGLPVGTGGLAITAGRGYI